MGSLEKILNYMIFSVAILFVMGAGICYVKNQVTMMTVCLLTAFMLVIQCKLDDILFIEDKKEEK